MHKTLALIAASAVLLAACAADDVGDGGGFDCDPAHDRVGTYLVTSTQLNGDCAPVPDTVITLPAPVDPNCTIEANTWSPDQCTNYTTVKCDAVDDMGPYSIRATGSLTQQDEAGDTLRGVITWIGFDDLGTFCTSDYDTLYDRQ